MKTLPSSVSVILVLFLSVSVCYGRVLESSSTLIVYQPTHHALSRTSKQLLSTSFEDNASGFMIQNGIAGSFKIVGGIAYSRPNCLKIGEESVSCFYVGDDDKAHKQTVTNTYSKSVVGIQGNIYGNMQCVAVNNKRVDCFALGEDNTLMVTSWKQNQKLTEWKPINKRHPASEIGRRACVSLGHKGSDCLLRLEGNYPGNALISKGVPSKFSILEGTYHTPFACVSTEPGSIYCYAACSDNRLCVVSQEKDSDWNHPDIEPTILVSSEPTAILVSETQHHVFSIGLDKRLIHVTFNKDNGYSSANIIGDLALLESPECVLHSEGQLTCYGLGLDHSLYEIYYDGVSWTEWELKGGSFLETPSCVLSSDSEILCILRSFRSTLIQAQFQTSSYSAKLT